MCIIRVIWFFVLFFNIREGWWPSRNAKLVKRFNTIYFFTRSYSIINFWFFFLFLFNRNIVPVAEYYFILTNYFSQLKHRSDILCRIEWKYLATFYKVTIQFDFVIVLKSKLGKVSLRIIYERFRRHDVCIFTLGHVLIYNCIQY